MDVKQLASYLLAKPEAYEDYPFGPDVAVYKVRGKMFATVSIREATPQTNLKCDPNEALALRDIFDSVIAGYHMNKKHWNTVLLEGDVPAFELERMVDNSYGLVVKSLKKIERQALELKYGEVALYGKST